MYINFPYENYDEVSHLFVAQRLARRLCKTLKTLVEDVPKQALVQLRFNMEEVDSTEIYKPVGFGDCSNGYKSREGVYQVNEKA